MPPSTKRKRPSNPSTLDDGDVSAANSSSANMNNPTTKRTRSANTTTTSLSSPSHRRTRSSASSINQVSAPNGNDADADDDGSEQQRIAEALEHGEGGERGTMRMEDPPKAGLVDPVGYKTNKPPTDRPVRIYADGVFDLFHLGHMRQLQQAKQAFPSVHLIVGVTGDAETHRRKGLTVLSAKERAESVRHCRWVDEVIEDCPWIIADAPEFMEKHKIDYVAHDDIPYGADEGDDIYQPIKAAGKFLVTQRTEGVSTTGIITKVVKDYDKYIARQLRRGTTRQELNVSWLKANELEVKRTVAELRDTIKSNWSTTGQELAREIRGFWQNATPASLSRPASPARAGREMPSTASPAPGRTPLVGRSLDIPRSGATASPAPGGREAGSADFAAGYSLGLMGGVRAWMAKNKRNLNDRQVDSDSNDESSPARSPVEEAGRGRKGRVGQGSK